jgi:hypothetical protein
MKFIIDGQIDDDRMMQFAGQLGHLPQSLVQQCESQWQGNMSMDFYAGLLAGYANAYFLASDRGVSDAHRGELIGCLVAFVADKMKQRQK